MSQVDTAGATNLRRMLLTWALGAGTLLLACGQGAHAAAVQLQSGTAAIEYDDAISSVSVFTFDAVTNTITLELATSVDVNGIFNDLIRITATNLPTGTLTLDQTIFNNGPQPMEEWVEEAFTLLNPSGDSGTVDWDTFVSQAFDSSPARPGTLSETLLLGMVPALTFVPDTPLGQNEGFSLLKTIDFTGPLDDDFAGVQVLAFGAALPLPPAVVLLASALGLLGLAARRRI